MDALGTSAGRGDSSDDDDSSAVTRCYAESTSVETFGKQAMGNRPELAYLIGARLITVNEIPEGSDLEARIVKAWTGGDAIEATPKYGHPLKFYADGTLLFVGNELPEIDFADDAMWERTHVLEFPETIPAAERDRGLRARFAPEAILAWMVEGHREFRRIGLKPPKACRLAREHARAEANPLADFWHEWTQPDPNNWISRRDLYAGYRNWGMSGGVATRDLLTRRNFTLAVNASLSTHGLRRAKRRGSDGYCGVRVGPTPGGDE